MDQLVNDQCFFFGGGQNSLATRPETQCLNSTTFVVILWKGSPRSDPIRTTNLYCHTFRVSHPDRDDHDVPLLVTFSKDFPRGHVSSIFPSTTKTSELLRTSVFIYDSLLIICY